MYHIAILLIRYYNGFKLHLEEDIFMDQKYVVLQVTLKEKLIGTGSKNLTQLENVINAQAAKGYRLHTISTASANSTGFGGGDRIQATMVFEKIERVGIQKD